MFNLKNVEGEMRIRDLELAERLEFANRLDIRKLIKRHEKKLNEFSILATVARIHEGAGRPTNEYYLDQKQSIFICMKSETDKAFDVQADIVRVYDQVVKRTYRPKSFVEDIIEGMKRNEVRLLGFNQMSLTDRKTMKSLHWEIQQSLGLTSKKAMKRRIDMRAPLNLLINGISSGEFRRRIGLQGLHRDSDNRPMKTVDFFPRENQYALFRTDLLLSEFLRINDYNVTYQEACEWYLHYGQTAKRETEKMFSVNLHDSVAQSLRLILGFVEEQAALDVSPYSAVERQIKTVTRQSIKRRPIAQAA